VVHLQTPLLLCFKSLISGIPNPQWLTLLEELGGARRRHVPSWLAAVPPNVHLKAKACQVPIDKVLTFWEAVPCIKRESSIVTIEALPYFIGAENLGLENFWSVTAELAVPDLVISSNHDGDNLNLLAFPFDFLQMQS
jgi:hypothetical protein